MGRNRTGSPCTVGRLPAHAPSRRPSTHPAAGWPDRRQRSHAPVAGSITDDDDDRRQRAKTILAH